MLRRLVCVAVSVLWLCQVARALPDSNLHQLRVEIDAQMDLGDSADAINLRLEPLCREACSEDPRTPVDFQVPPEGAKVVTLPPGEWKLSSLSPFSWIRPQPLELSAGGASIASFMAWPAGFIEADLKAIDSSEGPYEVFIRFESPEGRTIGRQEEVCAVEAGRLRCKLPAVPLDLRFEASGFVPIYRWATDVDRGATKRLGTFTLQPGSSIVGTVDPPEREFAFESVEVRLAPLSAQAATEEDRRRLSSLGREARVDRRGFFQISGVRPGRYALTLDHPRYAATRLDVSVASDEELELALLELAPPATLALEIDHPVDPYLKPWNLELTQRGLEHGRYVQVAQMSVPPEGWVELDGLDPGDYLLSLTDSRGSRWHHESIELFPGHNPVAPEIKFRRLIGTIVFDDEPLPGAEVELREHRGSLSFRYRSRDDGKFYAFLRHGALWDLKVVHEPSNVLASFEEVDIPPTVKGKNHAEKTFEIPDTEIFGEVVELDGRPVEDPLVLSLAGEVTFQRVLGESSFTFRGLAPGTVYLEAKVDGSASKRRAGTSLTQVGLTEGSAQGPVRLVLEDRRLVEGMIYGPDGGGIPGAQVIALVESLDGGLPSRRIPEATSDQDGVFELAVPAAAEVVQLTAFPPGLAIAQQRVDLRSLAGQPVLVPVDDQSGTLTVRYELPLERRQEAIDLSRGSTHLVADFVIPGMVAASWSSSVGQAGSTADRWVVEGLPPGTISVCFGLPLQLWLQPGGVGSSEALRRSCVDGELAPGGHLDLAIPEDLIVAALPERSG